ncbi:hypothetical protein LDENG_00269250 [Lucifuga dentata]|nr:hypothetical protein LDENG_00269250 [Lucifuga dentata]
MYAPNEDCPEFMSNIVILFNQYCKGMRILAGDFNCVLNDNLDRSSSVKSNMRSLRTLKNMCQDLGLVDIWRELHPAIKDYTFYSTPHKSYSRLDYVFLPSGFINCVRSCEIGSIVLSDHSPVYIEISGLSSLRTPYWRFNSSLLYENFCSFIKEKIFQYWQDNGLSPASNATKWEAAKATLRGYIISYTAWRKKLKDQNRKTLEEDVKQLEQLHKGAPTYNNWNLLISAKTKLNMEYSDHVQKLLSFSRQKFYQYGNKPSWLLAYQLNSERNERTIKAIKTSEGTTSYDPVIINNTFRNFYENLYTST